MDLKRIFGIGTIVVLLVAVMASVAVTPVEATTYSYNRQAAVNYALANWNKEVPG